MKLNRQYFAILVISFGVLTFFSQCGSEEASSTDTDSNNLVSEPVATSASTPNPAGVSPQVVSVQSEQGKELMAIDISSGETIIKYDQGKKVLTGESKRADKTKYFNNQGDIIAEVKLKEGSFKLKNTEGELLWKVKIKPEKIKISDNEEGENPFEIKENETGKFKVKTADKTLGEAKFKNGKVSVKGGQTFSIPATKNSPAYAALLIKEIPEDYRLIIAAELLKLP
ncbi:MAG: hypothetical protein AAFU64_01480 [Bacteroidota bacterium]